MLSVFAMIFTVLTGTNPETEIPSVLQVIQDVNQFAFSDDSSLFLFMDDGSFFMDPLGMCGRTVEGSWISLDSNRFEINGIWGWNNGISLINDKRRMTMYIYLRSMDTVSSESLWRSSDARLYDVYFVIEELIEVN